MKYVGGSDEVQITWLESDGEHTVYVKRGEQLPSEDQFGTAVPEEIRLGLAEQTTEWEGKEVDAARKRQEAELVADAVESVEGESEDEGLTGDALKERANELDIPNRSKMSADELRAAVAAAEEARG